MLEFLSVAMTPSHFLGSAGGFFSQLFSSVGVLEQLQSSGIVGFVYTTLHLKASNLPA